MSHALAYGAGMNLIVSHSRPTRIARTARAAAPIAARPDLGWIHDGIRHRVTVWPEVAFERETGSGRWVEIEFGEMVFASAALGVTPQQWRPYLEFMPPEQQEFLRLFHFSRMGALHVITRCPTLLPELTRFPALVPFIAAHVSLRGGNEPRWAEIGAVFEREGIFGMLQWLGLPASRQTLAILGNIADPEIPRRLLAPLRTALWEPEAIWALSHAPALTDERLAEACHALAA
ncbi:MAG: hypothetical protein ACREH8_20565 [Opitutaceae bacterium]